MLRGCALRDKRHIDGDTAEAIAVAHFTRLGNWVFTTAQMAPFDLVVINPKKIMLIDVKKLRKRINPGAKTPSKISRVRSRLQKKLGVILCYVDVDTGFIEISHHRDGND